MSNQARAGIAWGIIIAIVLLAVGSQSLRTGPTTQPAASPAARIQFDSAGKTAIGTEQLASGTGAAALPTLDWLARTPEMKLQSAIVAREVAGNEPALKRLDDLALEPSDEISEDISALRLAITEGGDKLDDASRRRLIERHGFFGELATTFGSPNTEPLRARLLAECRMAALVLVGVEVLGGAALLAGVILLVLAIIFWFEGKIRPAYVARQDSDPVWLEAFAVFLVVQVFGSMLVSALPDGSSLLMSWILTSPLGLAAVIGWAKLRRVGSHEIRNALGLHRGRGWLREAFMGALGYLAGLPILAAGFLLTVLLIRFSPTPPSHPLLGEPTDSIVHILVMYFIASVGAPVIEEIIFRGALFHHLRRRWNVLISACLVAFIFAAIHPQGWTTVPALGAIAVVLALIREWRASIVGPIVAHGLSNGLVYSLSLLIR